MKRCNRCGEVKEKTEFSVKRDNKDRIHGACKQCLNSWQKQYRENSPDRVKDSRLKRQFGLPLAEFNELLKKQNNVCKICNNFEKEDRALAVDHCHITGRVRGLLCKECNLGLGKFKDNPDLLEKALEYLKATT